MARRFLNGIELAEQTAPGTPATGAGVLYATSTGALWWKNDSGTSVELSAGGGVTRVEQTSISLGSMGAGSSSFTWTEVSNVGRALVARFVVTPSTATNAQFDVEVRDAASGGGDVWLQAIGVKGRAYDISAPWYVSSTGSVWVGVKNTGPARSFTLTRILYERFGYL